MTAMSRGRRIESFGPSVVRRADGSYQAKCTWCVFRIGTACVHRKPARDIPDTTNTPDWCEMLESMLRDVAEMDAKKAGT